jgi:ketosteroid isomerase-like protein
MAAGTPANPPVPVLQTLDPHKPMHAAVLRWQHALQSGDFNAWLAMQPTPAPQPHLKPFTTAQERGMFDMSRQNIPSTLFITAAAEDVNPNGSSDYAVFGCARMTGDARDIRLVAKVLLRQEGSAWKVFGSPFGPPWTRWAHVCPVVAGPIPF